MNKNKRFDERQLLYRYKGFTIGFIVLCSLIFIHAMLTSSGIMLFANEWASGFTMIAIATIITVTYQAINDAYISKNESYFSSIIFFQ